MKWLIIFLFILILASFLFSHRIYSGAAEVKSHIIDIPSAQEWHWIRDGLKKIKAVPQKKCYKIGDSITFKNSSDSISTKITDIHIYDNLEQYLHNEGIRECVPCATTLHDALKFHQNSPKKIMAIKFREA